MSSIEEIYAFAYEKKLEVHISNRERRTRIVILLPDGSVYSNGGRTNMEVCEAEDESPFACASKVAEKIKIRYEEIMEHKRARAQI